MNTGEFFNYILDCITFLLLTPTNMFISIVILLNWIKDKKLPLVDQLIASISVCNIAEEVMKSIKFLNIIYNSSKIRMIYFALYYMVMSCNAWFSTFLCVYFCLKIVNVKNTLYICLQRNFQKILPWLFVATILGSVLVRVPIILRISEENILTPKLNSTFLHFKRTNVLSFMILSWIAILIFSISALTIVHSLFKHMNQVQENFGGFRSPNMKAHVQALITVMLFLITNITISIVLTINLTSYSDIIYYIIIPLYSTSKLAGCWSLIKGNRNLDETLKNIFRKLHCTKTSNNME
ncbi:hypothetical protein GDO81_022021 [Engystomops pustulosus]|uniref:Taste receptor type 2 n=1 Tax=Engystomops pustulosus TaxID=76066 RepID=A0AAV6YXV6_ENGPU|nr:hypothetical protein GDO81_022021 [Engystomops pustulosus]